MVSLAEYLANQLESRDWSFRELARRSGVSHAQIGNVVNGGVRASADFCIKVAIALNSDPVAVLRLAGILPNAPGETTDAWLAEAWALVQQIPAEHRVTVIKMLRGVVSHQS